MQTAVDTTDYSKCTIVGIKRGSKAQRRDKYIYAKLVDENGETVIMATLDYIVSALARRLPEVA